MTADELIYKWAYAEFCQDCCDRMIPKDLSQVMWDNPTIRNDRMGRASWAMCGLESATGLDREEIARRLSQP